jgi:hypothetical protein
MSIKELIYEKCIEFVAKKISLSQQNIYLAQQTANSETKSSAGDKYETTRAMMQIEIQNSSKRLAEAQDLQSALQKIALQNQCEFVAVGSLVQTTQGTFFIAIGMGQLSLDDKCYFVVSPHSPIGSLLLRKALGEEFQFNHKAYKILDIC